MYTARRESAYATQYQRSLRFQNRKPSVWLVRHAKWTRSAYLLTNGRHKHIQTLMSEEHKLEESKPVVGQYRYRVVSTGGSSARYGPCEVCKGTCDVVYHQVEERFFTFQNETTGKKHAGWTSKDCSDLFGHEECVKSRQRQRVRGILPNPDPEGKSLDVARGLAWRRAANPDFSGEGEWMYEAEYDGLRVSCALNDGGPSAWVGHPVKDLWIDSGACDGSFESGAARAVELAWEVRRREDMRIHLELDT